MTTDHIRLERREDGIVVLTLDHPTQDVNTISEDFQASLTRAVDEIVAGREDITGVVVSTLR